MRLLPAILCLTFALLPARAQYLEINPVSGSRIAIEGRSSVNSFTCSTSEASGIALLNNRIQTASSSSYGFSKSDPRLHLDVPVSTLECGNRRMNSDMREALKAEEHPYIRYCLDDVTLKDRPQEADGWYAIGATGRFEIAGKERTVQVDVRGRHTENGIYQIEGSLPLRLSDYGIDRPSKLFGLITVHDEVHVTFSLATKTENAMIADAGPLPCD